MFSYQTYTHWKLLDLQFKYVGGIHFLYTMGGGTMKTAATIASIVFKNGGVHRQNYPFSFTHSNLPSVITMTAHDAIPRVVFCGGFPTRQEANETSLELVHVLDKLYMSSPNSIGSLMPALPGNVTKAFHLFCESTEVQNTVASLASDPNVLNAVLQNEEFQVLARSSHKSDGFHQTPAQFEKSSNDGSGYIRKITTRVVEMMKKLSEKFWGFFGENSETKIVAASAMGLAIMVIIILCIKRT